MKASKQLLLLSLQADPDLAVYLEEAFEQLSPHNGALKQLSGGLAPAGTDLLGLSLDEELTEEEELVQTPIPCLSYSVKSMYAFGTLKTVSA